MTITTLSNDELDQISGGEDSPSIGTFFAGAAGAIALAAASTVAGAAAAICGIAAAVSNTLSGPQDAGTGNAQQDVPYTDAMGNTYGS